MPQQQNGVRAAFDAKKEMHGGLEEISLSFCDARSMTSSQLMINTPIVIAATAAAGLSSARSALR